MEREKEPPRVRAESFSPGWQPLGQGLFYTTARFLDPKLEFWAIKADLSETALRIVVSGAEEEALSNRVLSAKVSSFVRDNGLIAGINTVPFDTVSAKEGEERQCIGIVISGGKMIAPPVSGYDALVFYNERGSINERNVKKAAILPQDAIKTFDGIENAVGGFHIILSNGELPERLLLNTTSANNQESFSKDAPRHPRSAAGLSNGGTILYLLVIDGRRPGSKGATEAETALILKKLGAEDGLNFDGGGSSALALRFSDGNVKTLNTPIHGGIPGRERAVAACLGIGTVAK